MMVSWLRIRNQYPQAKWAALGAKIEVPTLTGPTQLEVPAGRQSGDVRVSGHGMPEHRSGRTGDLLVQTYIEVPKKLTSRQRELLRELAELEHANVTPHRKTYLEKLKQYFSPEDGGAGRETDKIEE